MRDEDIRQRIQYLVQHGGMYPDSPVKWKVWVAVILALEITHVALEIMK